MYLHFFIIYICMGAIKSVIFHTCTLCSYFILINAYALFSNTYMYIYIYISYNKRILYIRYFRTN